MESAACGKFPRFATAPFMSLKTTAVAADGSKTARRPSISRSLEQIDTHGVRFAMNKAIVRSLAAAITLGLVVMAGCDTSAPKREGPPTYPVSGTVTQGGASVTDATVRFEPADGSQGATGRTDAQGAYTLSTFAAGDGALAGDYRVTIVKMEGEGAQAVSEDDPNYTGEEIDVEMKNVLPEKYSNAETSELTATVAEGTNTFDFPLE